MSAPGTYQRIRLPDAVAGARAVEIPPTVVPVAAGPTGFQVFAHVRVAREASLAGDLIVGTDLGEGVLDAELRVVEKIGDTITRAELVALRFTPATRRARERGEKERFPLWAMCIMVCGISLGAAWILYVVFRVILDGGWPR